MFVVRSGGSWDNPTIEFITEDEEIAKAICLQKKKEAFEEQQKNTKKYVASVRARYNLSKLQVESPGVKETLGEEEYEELLLKLEQDRESWSWAEKQEEKTLEQYKFSDWFYEKLDAPIISTLEEALKHESRRTWRHQERIYV